eukprot:4810091-Amphidinium_carterae.1
MKPDFDGHVYDEAGLRVRLEDNSSALLPCTRSANTYDSLKDLFKILLLEESSPTVNMYSIILSSSSEPLILALESKNLHCINLKATALQMILRLTIRRISNFDIAHAADLRHRALKVAYPHPAFGEMVGVWTSQDKKKAKALDPRGSIGRFLMCVARHGQAFETRGDYSWMVRTAAVTSAQPEQAWRSEKRPRSAVDDSTQPMIDSTASDDEEEGNAHLTPNVLVSHSTSSNLPLFQVMMAKMDKRKKSCLAEKSASSSKSLQEALEEAPWRKSAKKTVVVVSDEDIEDQQPLTVLTQAPSEPHQKVEAREEEVQQGYALSGDGVCWNMVHRHFHDGYRTKTYDVNQHQFIGAMPGDTEIFVDDY